MSTTYTDLAKTNFPDSIDVYNSTDQNKKIFKNAEDFVMADHMNSAQQMAIAIQRVLGVKPQGNKATVKERLDNIETSIPTIAEQKATEKVNALVPNLIANHVHDGATGHPGKIDLVNHVSGKLRITNLETTYGATGAITASNIYVSSGKTILQALDEKLDSGGGTVTGDITFNNVTIKKQVKERFYLDFIATEVNVDSTGGTLSTEPGNNSGYGIKNKIKNQDGTDRLFSYTTNNLYSFKYVYIVKLYNDGKSNLSDDDMLFKLIAQDKDGTAYTKTYKVKDTVSGWDTYCLTFEHLKSTNNEVTFYVEYNTKYNGLIVFDHAVVVPTHTAIIA